MIVLLNVTSWNEVVLINSPSAWWEDWEGFSRDTGVTSIGVSGGCFERYVG